MTIIDRQKNKILKALYDLHNNIFNADDVPSSLRLLSQDTGIEERRLKDICGLLEKEDLIEIIRIGKYANGRTHDHGTGFRVLPNKFNLCFKHRKRVV